MKSPGITSFRRHFGNDEVHFSQVLKYNEQLCTEMGNLITVTDFTVESNMARPDVYSGRIRGFFEACDGIIHGEWLLNGTCLYLDVSGIDVSPEEKRDIGGRMFDGCFDLEEYKPMDIKKILEALVKGIDRETYSKSAMIRARFPEAVDLPVFSLDDIEPEAKTCICFGPVSRKCPQHGDDK